MGECKWKVSCSSTMQVKSFHFVANLKYKSCGYLHVGILYKWWNWELGTWNSVRQTNTNEIIVNNM